MKSLLLTMASLCFFCFRIAAAECDLNITVQDNLAFSPTSLSISKSKCPEITIKLVHKGTLPRQSMGHNWVLTKTADAPAVAKAGWSAGLDKQYLPPGDKRIIAATDIIGGGESASITFATDALIVGGDYQYFCSFIGHSAVMKGTFKVDK